MAFLFSVLQPSCKDVICQLHKADPLGTLPKPCNAGFIEMEWVMENVT
jgi:hypothetical protein